MYTKPPNLYLRTAKLFSLGILLCIFTAGTALAAPPADKPCKGSKCETPNPEPQGPGNYVFWGDDVSSTFLEDLANGSRQCNLSQVAADFSSGTYDCVIGGNLVAYMIDQVPSTQIYARGTDWYCGDGWDDGYDSLLEIPDLQYSYSWSGNCLTGCDVSIVNRIGMDGSFLYSSITIEAFGSVITTDPEGNPFAEAQDVMVDHLLVTKFAPKPAHKVLAICESFPTLGMITFHTSLDPVTPD